MDKRYKTKKKTENLFSKILFVVCSSCQPAVEEDDDFLITPPPLALQSKRANKRTGFKTAIT